MDKTELHYLTYSENEIWQEMMLNYIAAGGDILYPGDEKDMLLRGVLADIVHVFAGVDNALRMQTLRYAIGDYLDVLGELRNCPRIEATKARATVTITTNATGQADTLEAGTTMTADGEQYYALIEAFTVTGYRQTATVSVEAVRAGSAGNGLSAGVQMHLLVSNPAVVSIVTASGASGGNEREDDEAYRERIRAHGAGVICTGSAKQYEAAAMAVSSEILDAKAVNAGAGHVTVSLIVDSDAEAGIVEAVETALSARDVRPLTDTVSVALARERPYTLNMYYEADSNVSLQQLTDAVDTYRKWQDNTIGQVFDPYRLMALLYQAGAKLVRWGEGSTFDGGAVDRTEIGETERCKGTIALLTT